MATFWYICTVVYPITGVPNFDPYLGPWAGSCGCSEKRIDPHPHQPDSTGSFEEPVSLLQDLAAMKIQTGRQFG